MNRIDTGDNLTGSSTVLKLEWTEVRSGGGAHQLISKDNDNQAAGSQFQEMGAHSVLGHCPLQCKVVDSIMITEQHPWILCQTLESCVWLC